MGCGQSSSGKTISAEPIPAAEIVLSRRSKHIFGVDEKFDGSKGCSSYIPKLLEFNLESLAVKSLQPPQNMHILIGNSAIESNKKIYVTGGFDPQRNEYMAKNYEYISEDNTCKELPSLDVPRGFHSSIVLNGLLYVIGGKRKASKNDAYLSKESVKPNPSLGEFATSICEVFDIQNGKWSFIPSLKKPRASHYCCIFKGAIYVFGGVNQDAEKVRRIRSIETYSVQKKAWSFHTFKLPYGILGSNVLAHPVENSLIILGGNYEGKVHWNLNFDLESGFLMSKEPLRFARSHSISAAYDNKMYVLGGDELNSLEYIDMKSHEWKIRMNVLKDEVDYKYSTASQPLILQKSQASSLPSIGLGSTDFEDTAFVFGDANNPFILQVDLKNEKIISKPIPPPLALYNNQPGLKLKGVSPPQYILIGGIQNSNDPVRRAFIYEPFANKARRVANLETKREYSSVIEKDGRIYAIGGRNYDKGEDNILASVERFALSGKKWEQIAPLNIKRYGSVAFVVSNSIYVAGGSAGHPYKYQDKLSKSEIVDLIERYDEAKNVWEVLNFKLQISIESGLALQTSLNEVIIVGGSFEGQDGEVEESNEIIRYNFKDDHKEAPQHAKIAKLKSARKNVMGFGSSKGYLILAGGEEVFCEIFDKSWKSVYPEFAEKIFAETELLNKGNENDYQLVL